MIPAYKYNLVLQKKHKWPEVCERVAVALQGAGGSSGVTDFHLEETTSSKHVALKRLYKTCEEFREFELVQTSRVDDMPYTSVSTLMQPTRKVISPELSSHLPNVLGRIGRSLPFHQTLFVLEGVPWKSTKCDLAITDRNIVRREIVRDCIVLCNDWWVSGRWHWLMVMVLPEIHEDALVLPANALEFINSLGKMRNNELIVFPEAGEESLKVHGAVQRAGQGQHEFVTAMKRIGDDLMCAGRLHAEVGNDPVERKPGFSRKKIIQDAVKDLGFRSLNSRNVPGYLSFARKSIRNNAITLSFDFGTWAPQCSAWLKIQGPLWSYVLEFPHVNYSVPGEISNPEEFAKSISNMRVVLEAAHDLIHEIELRHDVSPEWYRPYGE